jgi:hypothetical protein
MVGSSGRTSIAAAARLGDVRHRPGAGAQVASPPVAIYSIVGHTGGELAEPDDGVPFVGAGGVGAGWVVGGAGRGALAVLDATRAHAVENEGGGALGIAGGEEERQRSPLADAEQGRALGARAVEREADAFEQALRDGQLGRAQRDGRHLVIEADQAREGGEAGEEVGERRLLPGVLEVGVEAREQDQIGRAVAYDLVGDTDLTAREGPNLGGHAGALDHVSHPPPGPPARRKPHRAVGRTATLPGRARRVGGGRADRAGLWLLQHSALVPRKQAARPRRPRPAQI